MKIENNGRHLIDSTSDEVIVIVNGDAAHRTIAAFIQPAIDASRMEQMEAWKTTHQLATFECHGAQSANLG